MARIGIDLDGCAYPWAGEIRRYVSKKLGTELPPFIHWNSHEKDWGVTNAQLGELMEEALASGRLWKYGYPEEGFAKATWDLVEMGHRVVIATDRLQNTESASLARRVTRQWLLDVQANYDELIFTADKREANCDVFIDDRPQAIPLLLLAGTDAVYFDRPWNRKFPYPRVKSWTEFVDYIVQKTENGEIHVEV